MVQGAQGLAPWNRSRILLRMVLDHGNIIKLLYKNSFSIQYLWGINNTRVKITEY